MALLNLERIQERAHSFKALWQKARLPTLHQRRLQEIATLMYKVNALVNWNPYPLNPGEG